MRFSALYVFVLAVALPEYAEPKALPSADILLAISSAHEAYVFPYTFSGEHPQVDRKHLRPLDAAARDTLKRLLGDRRSWYVGLLTVAEPLGEPSTGVLFRTQGEELAIFFDPTTISATFRGGSYYDALALGLTLAVVILACDGWIIAGRYHRHRSPPARL